MSNGLSKAEIAKLQNALRFFGYSPGPTDGVFGSKTQKALNKFEADNKLAKSAKGKLNKQSAEALFAAC